MTTTMAEVYELYKGRKNARGMIVRRMAEVRDQYNGDIVIPLPELSANERPAIPNLLQQALDEMGMRVASTQPDVRYPPLRPGIKASENLADIRRKANLGWWDNSKMGLQLRRRSRHLLGYGSTVAQLRPDWDRKCPAWVIRDPLQSYPSPQRHIGDITPDNCIFAYSQTGAHLSRSFGFPMQAGAWSPDQKYEVLEYVDDTETVVVVVGPGMASEEMDTFSGLGKEIINLEPPSTLKTATGRTRTPGKSLIGMERIPNKAMVCPVVAAGRVTLDRLQGQFDAITGMYTMEARLMALEVIAVENGVFPNEWLVGRPNENPEIIVEASGRTGIVGQVRGGVIQSQSFNPGQQTYPTIDRLERAQRVTGRIPQEFGGESSTNIRTGRRGDSVLSATVDFTIQEAQDVMTEALQEENKRAIAIAKAYFGNEKATFYVNWKSARGQVDYVANDAFETDNNVVSYSHAGADANSLIVGIGQRVGLGMMSVQTGQEIDPLVDDPEMEHERVISEALEKASLQALQQQASTGGLAPHDLAVITMLVVEKKMTLYAAVQEAQKQAQARQAPQPDASGGDQPGLAAGMPSAQGAGDPTQAPDAQDPSISAPPQSLGNLATMIANLHRPQSQVAGSTPVTAPAQAA